MPIATVLIRENPVYRRNAFVAGLKACGFKVTNTVPRITPNDLLLIWNRYGVADRLAKDYERIGAPVIVAENGYLEMFETKKSFALALNHHNGAGRWFVGDGSRLDRIAVPIYAWRRPAVGEIIALPQRGIGPRGVAMPHGWEREIRHRIAKVRVRPHPGGNHMRVSLEADLAKAKACVTWGSGAAIRALCFGIPVFYEFPRWIGGSGAALGFDHVGDEDPVRLMGDRIGMLRRLAWAQWTVEEVESGEPFARLLEVHRKCVS